MLRCAFLNMDSTAEWSIDADLAFEPLAELGWHAEWLPWKTVDVDWNRWDVVYLAATWDYPDEPGRFIDVLEEIDASRALLVNPIDAVRWSVQKTYLRDLDERGVAIVPTEFFERFKECPTEDLYQRFDTDTLVFKPVIGANAQHAFLVPRAELSATRSAMADVFSSRPFMVQPCMRAIYDDGEYSLMYVAGDYSHAIRKVPKSGDFRVQEEHGSTITGATPTDAMRAVSERALAAADSDLLYARCDIVRDDDGRYCIMELELVEPSLYLRMDAAAPARFAVALDRYYRRYAENGEE